MGDPGAIPKLKHLKRVKPLDKLPNIEANLKTIDFVDRTHSKSVDNLNRTGEFGKVLNLVIDDKDNKVQELNV